VDLSVSTTIAAPEERRRLFFAQAAADASEEHIRQWFSQYGAVESVQLFSEATNGISSGCGYITMATSEQAAAALAAVQQNPQLQTPVGFLNVSWPLDEAGAAAPIATAAAAATSGNPMSALAANADRTVSNPRLQSAQQLQLPLLAVQLLRPAGWFLQDAA
jgi:RNA recognition motif-containing protein